jgi:hypothetical protein
LKKAVRSKKKKKKTKYGGARNHGVACRWRVAEVESSHARAHAECAMAAARKIHENNYDIFESTRARPSTAT